MSKPKIDFGEAKQVEAGLLLSKGPVIAVPTKAVASDFDAVNADGKAYAAKLTGKYSHKTLNGIGHNVPQEAPEEFAKTTIEAERFAEETEKPMVQGEIVG